MKKLLIVLLIALPMSGFACRTADECGLGERCVDGGVWGEGHCSSPSDDVYNTRSPYYNGGSDRTGQGCQANWDCGYGRVCVMTGYGRGVCR